MKTHLRVIRGGARKTSRWQWRLITVFEWIADVHLFIYPLLVVAFFWWLAYGHR
jgi:hypothetical protein